METKKNLPEMKKQSLENGSVNLENVEVVKPLSLQEQLEKQIEKLTKKKQLVDDRNFFLSKKSSLLRYKDYVVKDFDHMETKYAKISFVGFNEYQREEERVNVNNPQFVAKYIDYLVADIDRFVLEIEQQLLSEEIA